MNPSFADVRIKLQLDAILTGIVFFESSHQLISSRRRGEPAELIVMFEGQYRAEMPAADGSAKVLATSGDVVLWPAGAERLEINDPVHPTRCLTLYFTWHGESAHLPRLVRDEALVIRLLGLRLVALRQESQTPPPAVWNAYLNAMLAEYIRLTGRSNSAMVANVVNYIEHHMPESITLIDLAEAAELERHHFGRRFKKEMGLSPMDFLRRRRAEYALGLLATGNTWTIKTISKRVGMRDEVQLRRLLKRYTGINLRELKKMALRHKSNPHFWPAEILKHY